MSSINDFLCINHFKISQKRKILELIQGKCYTDDSSLGMLASRDWFANATYIEIKANQACTVRFIVYEIYTHLYTMPKCSNKESYKESFLCLISIYQMGSCWNKKQYFWGEWMESYLLVCEKEVPWKEMAYPTRSKEFGRG